jgi:Ca2+-binding RTX toxin-like protein
VVSKSRHARARRNNLILGVGGDDHIEGRDGNDALFGWNGIDFVDGGNDTDDCVGETVLNCE